METEQCQFSDVETVLTAAQLWRQAVEYLCSHAYIPADVAAPGLEDE